MESKVRIKLGPIEIDYEGSEVFLKAELPNLIQTVINLYKSVEIKAEEIDTANKKISNYQEGHEKITLSIESIAGKMKCKSGPDLVMAAAAQLTLVQDLSSFSSREITDEMKKASGQCLGSA